MIYLTPSELEALTAVRDRKAIRGPVFPAVRRLKAERMLIWVGPSDRDYVLAPSGVKALAAAEKAAR